MVERLDVFYMSRLSCHIELKELVKLVIILSHGNARAESGFSVNKEMLVENMSEGSLVAQRMFDGVMNEGGMLKFVNNAHSEYVKKLEKQKVQQNSGEKKRAEIKSQMN